MKVYRRREWKSGKLHSFVQLLLEPDEVDLLTRARLWDMKVQMYDGSLIGKTVAIPGLAQAFQVNVNRLRNRWSVAMVRTSGSVFIDILIVYIKAILLVFRLLWRLFFGSRKTVRTLKRGIKISSKRVETVKEAETFIFISVAALHHAMTFAKRDKTEDTFEGDSFLREIAGLTFSGAALGAAGLDASAMVPDGDALLAGEDDEALDEAGLDEEVFDADVADTLSNV